MLTSKWMNLEETLLPHFVPLSPY